MKKTLAIMLALIMVLAMVPALANGEVAKISATGTEYATLDEAITAAKDGDTIELLADCETSSGIKVEKKSLTIKSTGETKRKITLNDLGIYASSKEGNPEKKYLKFENCVLEIKADKNPSNGGGTANLISNYDLMFTNANISIVKNKEAGISGMYLYQQSNLYIIDGSQVTISGFNEEKASGIFADDSGKYENKPNRRIEVKGGSKLNISDCDWYGMTIDPIDVLVDSSTIDITNCGNQSYGGGIGCYSGKMTLTNNATVTTNNNRGGAWGIFVKELEMDGTSTLSSCNNKGDGIDIGGPGKIEKGAKLTLDGNKNAGLCVYAGSDYWYGNVEIPDGVTFSAQKNGRGIWVYLGGKLNMETGTVMYNSSDDYGGGVFNWGTSVLGNNVSLYNNHARIAGDDIYNVTSYYDYENGAPVKTKAKITFGGVGSDWWLDGAPDCDGKIHKIDGWYEDDANGKRWQAHKEKPEDNHILSVTAPNQPIEVKVAVKAAHGANAVEPTPVPTPGGNTGGNGGGNGGGYYHPTTTPVPVIVIPPKTGDMTIWQSILHFLGIR